MDGSDEEFLHHLARGSDLLSRGEGDPALASLQRAQELRPKDPKVLGLLGQALYKLGRYEEAAEAYQRLVDESPMESAARVNLGLANLKARRYPQAVRQLEVALELSPDHRKAMKYLGLAWLEQGEPLRARECFVRAGSDQMVARCDELLGPVDATTSENEPSDARPAEVAEPVPAPAPQDGAAGFLAARVAPPAPERTFAFADGLLTTTIAGDVLVRAEGLLAVRGAVRLAPEMKRFRGRPTEKQFGDAPRRMLRASGTGSLVHAPGDKGLARVGLIGESAYFKEDAVFAFDGDLLFENGRVASRAGSDLHLVHLRGQGDVLLSLAGGLLVLDVAAEAPARVRMGALVGWSGSLTPALVALTEGGGGDGEPADGVAVELTGEGRVLVDEGS